MRCAYRGEILTATAKMRGARGAVIDGYHRGHTESAGTSLAHIQPGQVYTGFWGKNAGSRL